MSRKLDIGVCSFGADPTKLRSAIESVKRHSVTDFKCYVIHNPSPGDDATREYILNAATDPRFVPVWMPENVGYVGAVNELFRIAETELIAYMDFDAEILTHGWDETLCGYLDRFHELGIMFPNMGHYAINAGAYWECLWAAGFCWIVNRMAQRATGLFNTEIGHHEEVQFLRRLRHEGYAIGCAPEVQVAHHETSTRSPESQQRINEGVVKWMDSEVKIFCGKNVGYHSPNVLRVLDWNINALYMERYFKLKLPGLNDDPEVVTIDGAEYDLIRVPRPKGFYRSRII